MNRTMKWMLITFVLVIFSVVSLGVMVHFATRHPSDSVLKVAIKGDIPEQTPEGAIDKLFGGKVSTVRDFVEAILRARDDERINGLLVTVDRSSLGFGSAQELRDAILEFRESGKWTVAYLETAGEFSSGNKAYYIATACESIWLSPPGDINLTGIRFEVPFVRGALDKLGVVPDFDHIGKYKSAKNFFTDRSMTEAHRESMEMIAESFYSQLKLGIAQGRGMTDDEIAKLIDRGPFTGPQALEIALVDELGYRDELEADLKERNGGKLPLIDIGDYLKEGRFYDGRVKVALIYGVGALTRGRSDQDPLYGSPTMGSDTMTAAIRQAREDDSIHAVVLRVNSPGGSYISSDVILREVLKTSEVKPVVVSMSDVAASGGYFISMGADSIIAEPGTLTASIGVVAGKFITDGFWEKLGITSDAVQRGRHATFYSSQSGYTPEERVIFESWLDRIYKDFVGKVAESREKSFEEIDAIAQGRVWTGEDALRLGLVDELGNLSLAIQRAVELSDAEPGARARLVVLPQRKGWFTELLAGAGETRARLESLRAGLLRLAEEGTIRRPRGVLEVPFVADFE
jgi:protease-4